MTKRLLVVDDEPSLLLRAVAACLKAENYEVSTARSGKVDLKTKRPCSFGWMHSYDPLMIGFLLQKGFPRRCFPALS